jgi:hypothetical protein
MTEMKSDDQVRQAITRIIYPYNATLLALTRNIQASVDVELGDMNNVWIEDVPKIEQEIRAIKGVTINDIFFMGIPHN